jgi:hypothetical protein
MVYGTTILASMAVAKHNLKDILSFSFGLQGLMWTTRTRTRDKGQGQGQDKGL